LSFVIYENSRNKSKWHHPATACIAVRRQPHERKLKYEEEEIKKSVQRFLAIRFTYEKKAKE
jgi:hypothetical protein